MDLPSPLPQFLALLPLIFSPYPSRLPPSHLAASTRQSHFYLQPALGTADYYQLAPPSRQIAEATERQRLRLVERGELDFQLGAVEYRCEAGEVRSRIVVGEDGLAIIMLWEEEIIDTRLGAPAEEESDRPAWTYLTMESLNSASSSNSAYHSSLEAAVAHAQRMQFASPPIAMSSVPSRSPPLDPTTPNKPNTRTMADGEGSTPGAYGNSEDFWDGWTSDDDEGSRVVAIASNPIAVQASFVGPDEDDGFGSDEDQYQSSGFCMNTVNASRAGADRYDVKPTSKASSMDAEEDSNYWASYGEGSSSIGEDEGSLNRAAPPTFATTSLTPATRSRRSSTIRAPSANQTGNLATLLASGEISLAAISSLNSPTMSVPPHRLPTPDSPFLLQSTTAAKSSTSAPAVESDPTMLPVLAGLWEIYKQRPGATRETFVSMAEQVSRS